MRSAREKSEHEKRKAKMRLHDLISRQLDPHDATPINMHEIRNYIYYGYSDHRMRPRYWKVLLNYFSPNKFKTEMFYKQARQSYHDILRKVDTKDQKVQAFRKTISSELDRSALVNKSALTAGSRDSIERILVAFSTINPCIGYVQGMINLVYVFYHVLSQDEDIEESKFAEEDAFYLFNSMVSEMSNLFVGELDDQRKGLKDKVGEIFRIVETKDPVLYEVLIRKELDRSMFPVRWILLLFSAEYSIDETIWLWDKILSDSYRFEMLLYCSAAVIILLRNVIIGESFEKCMLVLQKPSVVAPDLMFDIADIMRRDERDINAIIKERIKQAACYVLLCSKIFSFPGMAEQITEGTARIVKGDDTFFNPAQKLNRDMSAAAIRAYFGERGGIRILTSMSATGLRGIRYLNEIPQSILFFNDICPRAITAIQENLKLNGFEQFRVYSDTEDIRQAPERINITLSDCHVLMNRFRAYFDVIDVDPFGSCAEFVNSAFRAVRHNGLICFTCTDKASLCTNEPKCFMKYATVIKKLYCKNETPIRALLSYISREFAKYNARIAPIVSMSVDFYVRVIVRVFKGQGKSALRDNSLVGICECLNKAEVPLGKPASAVCSLCGGEMVLYGPFWNREVHDAAVVERMIANTPEEGNERMVGILRLMQQELPDMFYYEVPTLSSRLRISCCRIRDVLNALANAGYRVSLTHCDNNAFKTNAPLVVVQEVMVQWSSQTSGKFSFEPNELVVRILGQQYYRGKIMSGLKPLSLPKK